MLKEPRQEAEPAVRRMSQVARRWTVAFLGSCSAGPRALVSLTTRRKQTNPTSTTGLFTTKVGAQLIKGHLRHLALTRFGSPGDSCEPPTMPSNYIYYSTVRCWQGKVTKLKQRMVGARTLLGAKGIATRSKDATNGAPGRTTRSKDAIRNIMIHRIHLSKPPLSPPKQLRRQSLWGTVRPEAVPARGVS